MVGLVPDGEARGLLLCVEPREGLAVSFFDGESLASARALSAFLCNKYDNKCILDN